jgi:hypothetical protein
MGLMIAFKLLAMDEHRWRAGTERTGCRSCAPACGSLTECKWKVRRIRIGRTPTDRAIRSTTLDTTS